MFTASRFAACSVESCLARVNIIPHCIAWHDACLNGLSIKFPLEQKIN